MLPRTTWVTTDQGRGPETSRNAAQDGCACGLSTAPDSSGRAGEGGGDQGLCTRRPCSDPGPHLRASVLVQPPWAVGGCTQGSPLNTQGRPQPQPGPDGVPGGYVSEESVRGRQSIHCAPPAPESSPRRRKGSLRPAERPGGAQAQAPRHPRACKDLREDITSPPLPPPPCTV